MIRVNQNGARKYKSTGISILPQYWDFKKNIPKSNCPNKEVIEKLIINKLKTFNDKIIEHKAEDKSFTAQSLIDKVNNPTKIQTVGELFKQKIEIFKNENRIAYSQSFLQTYNSLIEYNKHLDLYFSDLNELWLRKYESYLKGKELSNNTIGIRMRNIRTIYNLAIKEGHVKEEHYPFKDYKVSQLNETTPKRAITKNNVKKLVNYKEEKEVNTPYKALAIDLFTFSYLTGGINFTDISRLTRENIMEEQLVYRRKKTKKLIHLPLHPKAMEIINKYKSSGLYLFPILSSFHKTEQQKLNRIHKVIGKVNKHLKSLGKELEIDKKITTYVARHSFSTTLKRAGVSTSVISEALGHSSEKVTQIYLDSFENTQMSNAMQNLL